MTKSKGEAMLRVVGGIFEDILLTYPTSTGLLRDLSRLTLCFENRGIRVFTLDLPTLDEFTLASLEARRLVKATNFLTKRRSSRDERPRFLWDLWSRIFNADGGLNESADSTALFFLRQLCCLGKKLALDCTEDRTEAARLEYHSIEAGIRPPSLHWEDDDLGDFARLSFVDDAVVDNSGQLSLFPEDRDFTHFRELDFVCSVLTAELGLFYEPVLDRFSHGPGAVADGSGRTYKFDFPHWPAKLDGFFPYDWCGSHTILPGRAPSLSEPPSRLIAVPKTAKGPRLIASEPVAHQWAQQWIKNEIVERARSCRLGKFVNVLDQKPSQEMVRRASQDHSMATLDLSSASDRLSCWHVERLLAANESLLRLCHAARTRWVRDAIGERTEFLRLKKFAAMGSALTFPIQSIFFACVALAACGCRTTKDIDRMVGRVRVFGDDIIVPEEGYESTVSLLTRLGLKVNVQKSFCYGDFRESCGLDAFRGDDVTPLKPKKMWIDCPEDYVSLIDTCNNLFQKGCWRASRVVERQIRWRSFIPDVVHESFGSLGVFTYCRDVPLPKGRWNPSLQRVEISRQVLTARTNAHTPTEACGLLDFFTQARRLERSREESTFMGIEFPITVGRRDRPSAVLRRVWVDATAA